MEQQWDKEEEDIDGYEGAIVFDPKELVYNYLPDISIPVKVTPVIVNQKKHILMLDIVLNSNTIINL
jgi:hypothetical protein